MAKGQSYVHGRNDSTGRYVSPEKAKADRDHNSVIHNPKAGYGDTGRYDDKKK